MAFKKDSEFYYEFRQEGIDEVIDEAPGSNSFIALREVRWGPDKDFKLDLRKYICKGDGTEVIGKGVSFVTEDGPNTLVDVLVEHGYGRTVDILDQLSHREDFPEALGACLICASQIDENFKSKVEEACKNAEQGKKSARDMLSEIL